MMNVFRQSVIILSVIMLSVIMLSVIMLSVNMLSVNMLSALAPLSHPTLTQIQITNFDQYYKTFYSRNKCVAAHFSLIYPCLTFVSEASLPKCGSIRDIRITCSRVI
jgi:hypothetical protein